MRDKSDQADESGLDQSDSIWAIVVGTSKTFSIPIDTVIHEMSYANVVLYGAVMPPIRHPGKDGKNKPDHPQEVIDACDPKNKDRITDLLNNIKD